MAEEFTDEQLKAFEWCLTLPAEFVEATDFKAEEAIKIDFKKPLPSSFSLWKWIYKTSDQWALGSCTAMGTTHWVQILIVKKNWVEPKDSNIFTPDWKDLWGKMWHSTEKYDGWDYVEVAVKTALKQWIYIEENWKLAKFDGYAYWNWDSTEYDKDINMMKHYLYNWNPIVWCVRWDVQMWREMAKWEVVTNPKVTTGWHCIALVGWDESGFWFINSWTPNDANKRKCRFHVTYENLKKIWVKFNFRYWILYVEEDAKLDPEYLKMKNWALVVLQYFKKVYDKEPIQVKEAIVTLSKALRDVYPEINEELPL